MLARQSHALRATNRSADWQSAGSRIVNPRTPQRFTRLGAPHAQPITSRRHSRLPTCATGMATRAARADWRGRGCCHSGGWIAHGSRGVRTG